jgi:hypothetical protein
LTRNGKNDLYLVFWGVKLKVWVCAYVIAIRNTRHAGLSLRGGSLRIGEELVWFELQELCFAALQLQYFLRFFMNAYVIGI